MRALYSAEPGSMPGLKRMARWPSSRVYVSQSVPRSQRAMCSSFWVGCPVKGFAREAGRSAVRKNAECIFRKVQMTRFWVVKFFVVA